jgi:hypothetical protein
MRPAAGAFKFLSRVIFQLVIEFGIAHSVIGAMMFRPTT